MMQPRAKFLSLAEELQTNILSLLPYRDILRCASVCKALRQKYSSSDELQYIVELGGQQLIHVPSNNASSISRRLQLLREETHAWFKFDMHSFKKVSKPGHFYANPSLANGHLYLWDYVDKSAKIFPVLPEPSQQTIERVWPPGSLCSVHDVRIADVSMDPSQNLIAVAYHVYAGGNIHLRADDERFFIELGTLDGDGVHPKAAGRTLFLSRLPGREYHRFWEERWKLQIMGRHIAFRRSLLDDDCGIIINDEVWSLHIWDWQHSTTTSSVLTGETVLHNPDSSMDFCFLGKDRLLTVSDNLKLYSIEDMSRAPQLLACFLFPAPMTGLQCFLSMDGVVPSSQMQMQAKSAMWTSDPENRLLCLVVSLHDLVFVISTRIFFDVDLFKGMTEAIPWTIWGPSNTRAFEYHWGGKIDVSGNRVVHSFPVGGMTDTRDPEFKLYMMDFSPSTVERPHGLGLVITEPSTIIIKIITQDDRDEELTLTTSLPYVRVASDRKFGPNELVDIWVEKDRIYLHKEKTHPYTVDDFEVIEF